jgi:hypothetical protein
MKKLVVFTIIVLGFVSIQAQNVKLIEEPAIKGLYKEHKIQKERHSELKGFRIQLYSSSNYENAKQVRFDFVQAFNDVSVYLKYQQPNYKVRVGNFRTRLEAEKFKAELELNNQFKACFIVPDKIEFPKL